MKKNILVQINKNLTKIKRLHLLYHSSMVSVIQSKKLIGKNVYSWKKVDVRRYLIKFCKIQSRSSVSERLFLIKLQASACGFINKVTLALVFSCEFCKIFMNNFVTDTSGGCVCLFTQLRDCSSYSYIYFDDIDFQYFP